MTRIVALAAVAALLSGCAANVRAARRAPLADEGEVFLYLEPLADDAARIDLELKSVVALRVDGFPSPLELRAARVSRSGDGGDHRLLASGRLPPGEYRGFAVQLAAAGVTKEGERAQLLVPADPVELAALFTVSRGRAVVLSARLHGSEAVREGFAFHPAFSIVQAERPIPGLLGLCSLGSDHAVSAFDVQRHRVVAVLPTGADPRGLAIVPSTLRGYVALAGSDELAVLDLSGLAELQRIRLGGGDEPTDVIRLRSGLLLTANARSNSASFVDPVQGVEVGRAATGEEPVALVADPSGANRAYVVNRRGGSITAVDVGTFQPVVTVTVDAEPIRAQASRRGDRLYVVHRGSAYLTVLSLPDLQPLDRIFVGLGASAVQVDPRTDLVYVGREDESGIEVYDPAARVPVSRFDLPGGVSWLAIDDERNALVALMPGKRRVVFLDLTTGRRLGSLDVDAEPWAISLVGQRH